MSKSRLKGRHRIAELKSRSDVDDGSGDQVVFKARDIGIFSFIRDGFFHVISCLKVVWKYLIRVLMGSPYQMMLSWLKWTAIADRESLLDLIK